MAKVRQMSVVIGLRKTGCSWWNLFREKKTTSSIQLQRNSDKMRRSYYHHP